MIICSQIHHAHGCVLSSDLLCGPLDCSPPGSSVYWIFYASILEWVAISSSRGFSWPRDRTCNSNVSCIEGGYFTTWAIKILYILSPKVIQFSSVQFSRVQSLSRVRLFVTPWIAACQASLSITNSRSSLRLTSIESVMPSSHLILCRLLGSSPRGSRVIRRGDG